MMSSNYTIGDTHLFIYTYDIPSDNS